MNDLRKGFMAVNKANTFGELEQDLARIAKALSHPARIAIMRTLAEKKSCICGEIVEVMPLSQSTVSQHLKELKNAGLIKGEVDGIRSCYCIDWENFNAFLGQFDSFGTSLRNCCAPDCC